MRIAEVAAGYVWSGLLEWATHRYLLHGGGPNAGRLGQSLRRRSAHFRRHHRQAAIRAFVDDDYRQPPWRSRAHGGELVMLLTGALLHAPLLPVAPAFTLTVWACIGSYYRTHRRAHLDPEWALAHVPWHVEHHLARNQDVNWGVRNPWVDWLLGTRQRSPEALERLRVALQAK